MRPATARHDRVAYFLHGADTAALEMRIVKLTKRAVDAIAGDASPLITYDADLTGFGLQEDRRARSPGPQHTRGE